jgi:hypothetical protein
VAREVHAIGALEQLALVDQTLDLVELGAEQLPALSDLRQPGGRLPERIGRLLSPAPALRPGLDRPPLDLGLLGRDYALAAAAPPSRAQDSRPARGALPAGHRQPHALGAPRRVQGNAGTRS